VNKFRVYLAGAMSNLSFEEMNNWRVKATKLFKQYPDNIHTINPVVHYNFEMDRNSYTDKEVKEFDLYHIKNSNIILVNLDHPNSIGTAIELECASRFWNIPIIAFGGENYFVHPWIKECVIKYCENLEEAVEHIVEYYFVNF